MRPVLERRVPGPVGILDGLTAYTAESGVGDQLMGSREDGDGVQLDGAQPAPRLRVGLVALERVPVREHVELQNDAGQKVGEVTSGLLAPTADKPVALAYVQTQYAQVGTRLNAMVRGKAVPMEVSPLPFVPNRYYRG